MIEGDVQLQQVRTSVASDHVSYSRAQSTRRHSMSEELSDGMKRDERRTDLAINFPNM
jgi:hypothetical protein